MNRLIVKDIGPIKYVDLDLKKINVFIGPQGKGKSTLAKIISFCSWLEKRRAEDLPYIDAYKRLKTYHRLGEYFTDSSMILYQGENVVYAYGWPDEKAIPLPDGFRINETNILHVNEKESFYFALSPKVNPKVIYIPAERNFVSAVPALQDYVEEKDNLQGFVVDWYRAKNKYNESNKLSILNLGVKFFSSGPASDYLMLEDGKTIRLNSSASGYQSVTPLVTMVDWLSDGIYKEEKPLSPAEDKVISDILSKISNPLDPEEIKNFHRRFMAIMEGRVYSHTQFVIEEPCQNLYPDAQRDLVYYLIASLDQGKNHRLVMTTHSPYVLSSLNNLIYAYKVGQNHKEEVENIIPSSSWINCDDINVFYVDGGGVENIVDEELQQIKAERLDQVSTVLNEEFDRLLDIEE